MSDVFEKNDRLARRHQDKTREQMEAYRAFRDIIQKAIFDEKNYDISIVEVYKALGLIK